MIKKIIASLAFLLPLVANAQSLLDQVFKTIAPNNERAAYSFFSYDNQTKILCYGNGRSIVYDDKWNVIEDHNAGQEDIEIGNLCLKRSYNYDSSNKTYTTTEWEEDFHSDLESKYSYIIWSDNYTKFFNGEASKLYYIRNVQKKFIRQHYVYTFEEYCTGIAGKPSYVSNYYTALTTEFDIVDWDGNVLCKVDPPYYFGSAYGQVIDVNDKTYIIINAYSMYPKNIISDCDTYSVQEYDISSEQIEPNYYHYFIYYYDSKTSSVQMVRSDKSLANRKEVARYDTNGVKLSNPQKGVNIILYSDGTSKSVVEQ